MGLLRVEEHDITGTERYCDAKPRKGEMYDWTISEDIIGSCVRTHSTVRKIIVIMGEPGERGGDRVDPKFWSSIASFEDIYLVNGSPLKQETLLSANLNFADKVVILGKDSTLGKEKSKLDEP